MTSAERRKLIGVLGRLGSDHDGERAAAGLLASRMLKSAGVTWDELLTAGAYFAAPRSSPSGWRGDLAVCQRHRSFLRPWEQDFVGSVATRATLSQKQRFVLSEMADGLRARGKK